MQKIDLNGKTILVTGSAGFIGSNLVKRLFNDLHNATIIGIDNMNDYYDVALKEYRLKMLEGRWKKEDVIIAYWLLGHFNFLLYIILFFKKVLITFPNQFI